MNNTINSYNSNTAFGARYIQFNNPEQMPKKVYEAILKNDAIESFLNEGKPKTLVGKFADLFRSAEVLYVDYEADLFSKYKENFKEISKDNSLDPYIRRDKLIFTFGKENSFVADRKHCDFIGFQQGIRRQAGSIPKPGEHHAYKPPVKTAEDKIAEQVNNIKDFGSKLKYYA